VKRKKIHLVEYQVFSKSCDLPTLHLLHPMHQTRVHYFMVTCMAIKSFIASSHSAHPFNIRMKLIRFADFVSAINNWFNGQNP